MTNYLRRLALWLAVLLSSALPWNLARAEAEILRVTLSGFVPYAFQNDDGAADGFSIEVLETILRGSGAVIRPIKRENVEQRLGDLVSGHADIDAALVSTESRRDAAFFTRPIAWIDMRIYARTPDARTVADAWPQSLRVGYTEGSYSGVIAQAFPGIRRVPMPSNEAVLLKLASGEIDAAIYPENAFRGLATTLGIEDSFVPVGPVLDRIPLSIAVSRAHPALFARIDGALASFIHTREFALIQDRWLGTQSVFWTDRRIAEFAAIAVAIAAILAATLFLAYRRRMHLLIAELSRFNEDQKRRYGSLIDEAREQVETKNHEFQCLLTMVSNELANPLLAVSGMARRARSLTGRDAAGDMRDTLGSIAATTTRMSALLDGMLQLGQIGATQPIIERVALAELVADAGKTLAQELEAAGICIAPPPQIMLQSDRRLLRRALADLISHAVHQRGLSPGMQIEIVADADTNEVHIGVRDRGAALDAEQQSTIFAIGGTALPGPEEQDDPTSAPWQRRMEAATVARIAQILGGRTSVVSRPGAETTLWLHLPQDMTCKNARVPPKGCADAAIAPPSGPRDRLPNHAGGKMPATL